MDRANGYLISVKHRKLVEALLDYSGLDTEEIKELMPYTGNNDYYRTLMGVGSACINTLQDFIYTLNKSGGSAESSPTVDDDPNFKGTKADCIKQKLEAGESNSILNNLLAGFKLNSSVIDVKFYVDNTDYQGKPVKNGKCIYDPNTNKVSIYISENRLNKSSLEVARTLLHESFHAYLYGKIRQNAIHNGLAPEPDFVKDFANYSEVYGKGSSNSAQHNYMARMYIYYMKEGLESFFYSDPQYMEYASNNCSREHWDLESMLVGLAWEGLHGTDTWKEFKINNPAKVEEYNLQLSYFVNSDEFPKDCD